MIAKGTLHNSGARLAAYMVTGKEGERAELHELRGFAAADIRQAFRSIDAMKDGTRVEKPFFHAQVRNPEGEELTRAQWLKVADRIEAKLGYSGQPRAVAFHIDEKTGHEHMHVAWSRIDADTLQAKPLPFFKLRLKEACRELENDLDLTRVRSERPRVELAPSRAEEEQSRRLDTDLHGIRGTIRQAYEQSDGGKAFAAALADKGLTLCQGERRDFIVLDQAGGIHLLGKRLLGDSAAEVRRGLADIDRAGLPTVDEARAQLAAERARQPETTRLPSPEQQATPEHTHSAQSPTPQREPAYEPYTPPLDPIAARAAWAANLRALAEAREPEPKPAQPAMQKAPEVARTVERAADKMEHVAAKVGGGVIGAVESVAAGLENFLFGGTKAPAQERQAAPPPVAPAAAPANAEAKAFKREIDLTAPEVAVQSADFQAKKDTFTLGVRPELVEAMRRKMEQARAREREDDERDRER
ncbi:MAG: relaxase/mobilization nuclease domain-containing protein [Proteobacteria bacterium]|nr:relaxase/mobilization nuclease domain-containing protein [Pseudomonadota bacterium]